MSVYVISTMTAAVSYCFYDKVDGMPIVRDKVTIHGGAGIPSLRSGFGEASKDSEGHPLWTAEGIVTTLSDERYEKVKDHNLFKKHLERGYLKVVKQDIAGNHKAVKEVVRDMTARDGFAQLTPSTAKQRLKAKVQTVAEMEQEGGFRL